MTGDTKGLKNHVERLCACLAEAVAFAEAESPGTGHNAGMWAAAIAEARAALEADRGNDAELCCIEYSEYSRRLGMYPLNLAPLSNALKHNLQDMIWNNRKANKWQVIFVGTLSQCGAAIAEFERQIEGLKRE